jgi:cell division protein FtsI/penicillin-binding protein 2
MIVWKDQKKASKKQVELKNNRLNFVIAIVFLLGILLSFKLFSLQVLKHDFYSEIASGQHQISSDLIPERGNIYFAPSKESGNKGLLPLATNKEFADIFAVPKDVVNAEDIAEKFYSVFKQAGVEKEVENLLTQDWQDKRKTEITSVKSLPIEEQQKKLDEVNKKYDQLLVDPTYLEYQEIKRQKEIEARKKIEIDKYLEKLKKANDPYESLEKRVDESMLKKLYALLYSNTQRSIQPDDLEIKQGKVFWKQSNDLKTLESDQEVVVAGINFTMNTYRFYPEDNIASQLLGFARDRDGEIRGDYGLEGFFDEELFGTYGYVKSERSADKNAIILNDREYLPAVSGSDIVLTIDRNIEYAVCEKLKIAVEKNAADSGSVVVMKPKTGEIVAMCGYPDFNPNKYEEEKNLNVFNNSVIFSQYEPGSIFKAITMAMGLDQDKIKPDSIYNDTGVFKIAGYDIKNSDKLAHGIVNMTQVLEESLNTGVIYVMQQIGQEKFVEYIKKFGFGEKTGVELEGESKGDINNLVNSKGRVEKELYAATSSFGQGISVTVIQMAAAFSALANGGLLVKPYIVQEIDKADGEKVITKPTEPMRIISERASALLGGMLVEVVENGHGKKAGVPGYYVAGKTGTAQVARKDGKGYETDANIGSFAGFAPANNPAFAMVVRIDHPRNVVWAESSAAPLFGEIAQYLLDYYQVPKERSVGD